VVDGHPEVEAIRGIRIEESTRDLEIERAGEIGVGGGAVRQQHGDRRSDANDARPIDGAGGSLEAGAVRTVDAAAILVDDARRLRRLGQLELEADAAARDLAEGEGAARDDAEIGTNAARQRRAGRARRSLVGGEILAALRSEYLAAVDEV